VVQVHTQVLVVVAAEESQVASLGPILEIQLVDLDLVMVNLAERFLQLRWAVAAQLVKELHEQQELVVVAPPAEEEAPAVSVVEAVLADQPHLLLVEAVEVLVEEDIISTII
jgi:hypothetical protein